MDPIRFDPHFAQLLDLPAALDSADQGNEDRVRTLGMDPDFYRGPISSFGRRRSATQRPHCLDTRG
jgi:hypothetical protein